MKVPRCVRNLKVGPNSIGDLQIERRAHFCYFSVGCPCGEEAIQILGYEIPSYAAPDSRIFVGPIGLRCGTCETEHEIMDPEVDGYNGEIGSNTTARGSGNRTSWNCPHCSNSLSNAVVAFAYQIEVDDAMRGHREDFFDVFQLFAKCLQCKQVAEVTLFDCT